VRQQRGEFKKEISVDGGGNDNGQADYDRAYDHAKGYVLILADFLFYGKWRNLFDQRIRENEQDHAKHAVENGPQDLIQWQQHKGLRHFGFPLP
jgi:hypothetical protein